MRIGIGLGIGGRRRGVWRANIFGDSVNGSDANDGLTEATALQSASAVEAAALAFGNNVKLSFARNDLAGPWDAHFRGWLGLGSLTGVQIRCHGDPTKPMPKFSAADIAPAASFTLVPTRANTYQITWTHEIGADYSKRKISAWKAGVRLKWVASVALCEAEANTFHVATGAIANPATVYINVGGGNPGTGDDCEITAREYAVTLGEGCDVSDIHTTKQAHHDGSFVGGKGRATRVLSSEGVVHNQWVSPGSVHEGCVAYMTEPSTWRSLNATQFITFVGEGSPEITTYRDCWAYSDSPAGNSHTAIYAHTNGGAARLSGMVVDGLRAYGPSPQVTPADIDALSVANSLIEFLPGRSSSALGIGSSGIVSEVDNVTVINGARVCGNGAVNAQDLRVYINGSVSGGLFFSAANRLRNSTFVFNPATTEVNSAMFNTTGSAAEVLDCVIADAGDRQLRAATADSILSDRNVLYASGAFGSFAIAGTEGLQWTAHWKPQTGQDANSAAIANTGLNICADAPNGDFTLVRTIVGEGGRTAGSRKAIERPDWAAMVAAWEAGFIAPV